jgi:hypothetical protein
MRVTTLIALLAFTACAHASKPPAAEPAAAAPAQAAPATAEKLVAVEFASAAATHSGGEVSDTRYSEKPDDAAITDRTFADGLVTFVGQVGMGKGSQWAGIGLGVTLQAGGKPIDARNYRSVTFKLASPTTSALRLRITGSEEAVRNAGCYPVYVQGVTKDATEYTIPLAKFAAESYCGAQARSVEKTLGALQGFEVVDVAMKGAPTRFSVGTITLNP